MIGSAPSQLQEKFKHDDERPLEKKGSNEDVRGPSLRSDMRFDNNELERAYLESCAETMFLGLKRILKAVTIMLSLVSAASIAAFGSKALNMRPILAQQILRWIVVIVAILGYSWCSVSTNKGVRRYVMAEAILYTVIIVGMIAIVLGEKQRLCNMMDDDSKSVWNQTCFCDSSSLLYLELTQTVSQLFLPVRSCFSWVVPVAATVAYALSCILLDGPEFNSRNPTHQVVMICQVGALGFFAWWGRRRTERESRLMFLQNYQLNQQAEEQKQLVVQERILRYNAEHVVSPAPRSGQPSHASKSNPESSDQRSMFSLTLTPSIAQLDTSSQSGTEVASENDVPTEHLDVPPRQNRTPEQHARIKAPSTSSFAFLDSWTQTMASSLLLENANTQTDVAWGLDGFQCRRCTKPPQMPQRITNRDRVGMVAAAERNPKLKKILLKRRQQRQHSFSLASTSAKTMFQLPATPSSTVESSLHQLLICVNSVIPQLCCCPWHAALQNLINCAQDMKHSECHLDWQPIVGKQCQHCLLLAYDSEDVCCCCGRQAFRSFNEHSLPSNITSLRGAQKCMFILPDDAMLLCEAQTSADFVQACLVCEVRAGDRLLVLDHGAATMLSEVCSVHFLDHDSRRPWYEVICSQSNNDADEVSLLVSNDVLTSTRSGFQCEQPMALAMCEHLLVGLIPDESLGSKKGSSKFSAREFGKSIKDHLAKKTSNTKEQNWVAPSGTAIANFRNLLFPVVGKSTSSTPSQIVCIELKVDHAAMEQYLLVGCKCLASKPAGLGPFIAQSSCKGSQHKDYMPI